MKEEKGDFLSRLFLKLKERRIMETLAAFIAGGWLILEFVHWILIDHYHFPERILDIAFITIICSLLCTLLWRWFKTSPAVQRRIKLEIIFIPLIILFTLILNTYLFLQMKWPEEKITERSVWKNSIAVLPFRDLSQEQNLEIFCEGMTDDIATKLATISGLRVVSPTFSGLFNDQKSSWLKIGEELRVTFLLQGSLQTEGKNIKINVNLGDVKNGYSLWSKKYEPNLESYFQIEDEITNDISRELQLQIIEGRAKRTKEREPANFEAYRAYRQGRLEEERYRTYRRSEYFESSQRMFAEAIKLDPSYSLAYCGMGNLYEARYVREEQPKDFEMMSQYYRKAYEVNPAQPETILGMGWLYFHAEEIDLSYEFFLRAKDFEDISMQVNSDIGSFLRSVGLYSAAIKYYLQAIELDPFSIRTYSSGASCYMYLGKYGDACRLLNQALAIEPENPQLHLNLARQYLMMGENKKAEAEIEAAEKLAGEASLIRRHRAWLLAARGEREKAEALIEESDRLYNYDLTSIYALLGKKEEAIKNIEKGIAVGFKEVKDFLYSYPFLITNPFYSTLRDVKTFNQLLEREKRKYEIKKRKYSGL